jgi:type I restriction enzyme M protein
MSTSQQIVSKLWSYCNILRDDGLSYPDYVEQLTFLIFLKMASEQTNGESHRRLIPKEYDWSSLMSKRGRDLHSHYTRVLEALANGGQMLGLIFGSARNRIRDPVKLHRLIVELIDKEDWAAYDADIKGDAYEGLLEKTAQDSKSGAGQYFTPRPLIRSIVEVLRPQPGQTTCDPACGTCGFLLGVREYILRHYPNLTAEQKRHQRDKAYRGIELVDSVARLGAMNLYLHGIGSTGASGMPPISVKDSLLEPSDEYYDLVLTNPPFGKKSSLPSSAEYNKAGRNGRPSLRKGLWAATGNKQLNFLQHVPGMLSPGGRAAVVVPDNVLFERGVGEVIRRRLMEEYDVHTLLRLPTGLFYAQGVKANVIFFDRPTRPKPTTKKWLWVYDLRTDMHFTLKTKRLRPADLEEFIECYADGAKSDRNETWSKRRRNGRWRAYAYADIERRPEFNLDLTWLTASSSGRAQPLLTPDVLAQSIALDLRTALSEIENLAARLAAPRRRKS